MKLFIKISAISAIALLTSENGILSIDNVIAMSDLSQEKTQSLETTPKTVNIPPKEESEIIESNTATTLDKKSDERPLTPISSTRLEEPAPTIRAKLDAKKLPSPIASPKLKKEKQIQRFTYSEFMQHDFSKDDTSPSAKSRSRRSSISVRPATADTLPSFIQSSPPPAPSPLRTSSSRPFSLEASTSISKEIFPASDPQPYAPSITRASPPPSIPTKSHSPALDAIDEGDRIINNLKKRGEYDRVFQGVNKWEWGQNKLDRKDPSFIQTRKASKKKSDG